MLTPPKKTLSFWLAALERLGVGGPVDGVAGEQAAEDHQFGGQEHPHPQRGGLVLLAHVLEVVRQFRRRVSCQHAPPRRSMYGPVVTTGVTLKLSGGGGEGVCHSSPVACHGLGPARRP